jgi:hypothetical protein
LTFTSENLHKLSFEEACRYHSGGQELPTYKKTTISIGIVIALVTIFNWISPEWLPGKYVFVPFTWPVMVASGLIQHWSLFAPDVRELNYHTLAYIEYKDGTIKCYELPRAQKMKGFERFRAEKKRKLFGDCLSWPNYSNFLPSVCRFIARANFNSQEPDNPPVKITIGHLSQEIQNSNVKPWIYRNELKEHTDKKIIFVYNTTPADFSNLQNNK